MGLFRRRKAAVGSAENNNGSATAGTFQPTEEQTQQTKEVMKDNLELMKEIVMRIREDPEFASNIYSNCPRLQHLLGQYPDLRPIFEDPKLVRINFEKVYRDAGGVLPEDEEKKKSLLVRIIESPLFRLLKWILFFKKLVACIAGGGFALISGCIICCCCEDALEDVGLDEDLELDAEDMDPMKEALNRAADRMEDPEVQEQMQALLEDPDNLQEAIENDPDLRALRDSNPLCEQLMSDPETMKVLTDPDNLRALGECPDLIQADFVDPDGFVSPDIETGDFDGLDQNGYDMNNGDGNDVDFSNTDMNLDMDLDGDADDGFTDGDDGLEQPDDDDGGWWDDAELEQQDADNNAADATDRNADATNNNNQANARQARQQARKTQTRAVTQATEGSNGRFGGIMASVGAAATNMVAAQIVGNIMDATGLGDILGGGGGDILSGGGGGGLTDLADDAGNVLDNDVTGVAEEVNNKVDEKAGETARGAGDRNHSQDDGKKNNSTTGSFAESLDDRSRDNQDKEADFFDDEVEAEEEPKKGLFGGIMSNLVSAVSTMAKEQVAGAILGDDLGEFVVEQFERDDKDNNSNNTRKDEAGQEPTAGLFGGRKNKVV